MAEGSDSRRLWRTAAIVAVVGVLVVALLAWLAVRMYDDMLNQRVIKANEAAALTTLQNIQAQEQSSLETGGQYVTFRQLADAGIIQTPTSGDTLVSDGYKFTLKVTPKLGTPR